MDELIKRLKTDNIVNSEKVVSEPEKITQSIDKPEAEKEEKKNKKKRCQYSHSTTSCKKILALHQHMNCKCGKMYCDVHRLPETHNCSYDYKEDKTALIAANPKIIADKVVKI